MSVGGGLLASALAFPLAYAGVLRRVVRALAAGEAPSHRAVARLYGAPRLAAAWLLCAAWAVLAAGWAPLGGVPFANVQSAALAGAAALVLASLVVYPAARLALRPVVEVLPSGGADGAPSPADSLGLRASLAVAVPTGVAALFAALIVGAHATEVWRLQGEHSARVYSRALGVPRVASEAQERSDPLARVLAAAGVRITPGVQFPQAEARAPGAPSPVWAVLVALALGSLGALVGRRIGRQATRELDAAARRMDRLGEGEDLGVARVVEARSVPEVAAMTEALDAVAESLAAMSRDQRRSRNAREEAAKLRSFVLAGVSHDLRGPLNAVLGFSGLLLSGVDGAVTAGQRESLEALARGGSDLLRLVDDLLDAARLDAGRLTLHRERVEARDLLELARTLCLERVGKALPEDTVIPLEGALGARLMVDRGRMAHCLGAVLAWGLLRPGRSGHAAAQVREGEAGMVVLTVRSEGSTPTRETLTQLFDPFEVAPAGARAPAGLELAMANARRVVALHRGSMRAEASDKGLVVRVELPQG
ncbi:MAG: HAMP domain-containing histidine kinase [Deltaproteobacteria bacterium]|nr:HAMP domain-containing histidine kinase [Deltaproteobacteria bacterium]